MIWDNTESIKKSNVKQKCEQSTLFACLHTILLHNVKLLHVEKFQFKLTDPISNIKGELNYPPDHHQTLGCS